MTDSDKLSTLYAIVARECGIEDKEIIHPESRLREDLGMDSLSFISLCVRMEEAFGVSIDEDTAHKVRTMADAEKLLSSS